MAFSIRLYRIWWTSSSVANATASSDALPEMATPFSPATTPSIRSTRRITGSIATG